MKKYLFGLGAMLVGAGLMFVLMHGEVSEVSADFFTSTDYTKVQCEILESDTVRTAVSYFTYCKIKDLTCVSATNGGLSCVKTFIS